MKKLLFLFLTISVLACSDDDDNRSVLNPPAWIQGTWVKEDPETGNKTYYKFTSDDICVNTCWSAIFKQNEIDGEMLNVRETSTGNTYRVDMDGWGRIYKLEYRRATPLTISEIDYFGNPTELTKVD